MTPAGRFTAPTDPGAQRTWLLVAAGSGITPMMSILRTALRDEPNSSVVLLFGNRSVSSIMFREELEDLKSKHVQRLAVHHFLSREGRNLPLYDGRLDGDKIRMACSSLLDMSRVDQAFVCGPGLMTDELRGTLGELGVAKVHVELFETPDSPGAPRAARPEVDEQAAADVVCDARIMVRGLETKVGIARGERVLDAAIRAGLDVPYACTGGVCSTCRAHCSDGAVEMVTNNALEDSEVEAGYALTCQSLPTSPELYVDFDRP
jgi:ring-1,2-phenylacetyl-CoA epoxidase subunit PaaE